MKICNLALICGRIAYELGYGADTMFHRTYFLFQFILLSFFIFVHAIIIRRTKMYILYKQIGVISIF